MGVYDKCMITTSIKELEIETENYEITDTIAASLKVRDISEKNLNSVGILLERRNLHIVLMGDYNIDLIKNTANKVKL